MSSNAIAISIVAAAFLIAGSILFEGSGTPKSAVPKNNVTIENGKQIIEIAVKGGYAPQSSLAKSGVPTILRMKTEGTFDCSSSIRIPKLGIAKNLPQTGTTDIDLGTPGAGVLEGSCGMGMYPFGINFQ